MDADTMSFGFSSSASRTYASTLKPYFELFIGFEDMKADDELRTIYPCPYCAEDFDLLELCCHIDLDHPLDSKSGICPVCAVWVGTNIVEHLKAQHGNIIKISFLICLKKFLCYSQNDYFRFVSLLPLFVKAFYICCCALPFLFNYYTSLTGYYGQLKSNHYKHDSYSTYSISRKDLEDDHWQYLSGGLPAMSTSKTVSDPFLSFLYNGAASAESESIQPDSSSEASIEEMHTTDTNVLERNVQPSLSDKDQSERARRSGFVQGLLMSTILDPDF